MAAVSALRASVGMAVSGGRGSGVVNTMAALVTAGVGMVVVGAVVGTAAAAAEAPEPDMADTRLLERGLL